MNLETMKLPQLVDLKRQVDKAITTFETRKKAEALAELEGVAQKHGVKLRDILNIPVTRAPAVQKYANPADPSDTWSGRGRKPNWFIAALDKGKTSDDLLI